MSRRRRNATAPRRQAPVRSSAVARRDYGFQEWIDLYQANWQNLAGQWPGFQMTWGGKDPAEPIGPNFADYVVGGMQSNGVVFALEQKRIQIFSQVRYQFQGFNSGRPGKLFPKPNLSLVERPWLGGTTSDLNARMLVDADLAGNSFWIESDGDMVRLRPDWVEIVLKPRMLPLGPDGESVQVGFKQAGILYYEGGLYAGAKPAVFLPGEYCHFAPMPDPLATYRGMSWLTPVIREIQADTQATKHKLKFYENAATPNLAVSLPKEITPDQFAAFVAKMDARHKGVEHAYETLYTGGGADVTVIGQNMHQLDFKVTQGAGETRLAAAAGIHPVIVGLSEGMQGSSLNSGNYNAAKRSTIDTTFRHLWQNAAGSLEQLVAPPDDISRLWYDARDVPFLHEDQKDIAEIQSMQASAIRQLTDAGYEAASVVKAINANDLDLLRHSGLFSVQLQRPGTGQEQADASGVGPKEQAARSADSGQDDDQELDDDPLGEVDEDSAALLVALGELDHDLSRAFNPRQPRNPKGSPGGGRFRSMVDRLKDAIAEHRKNDGKGDPFKDFNREQLRKVAKTRGIPLKRGEDRDSIAAKILADLGGPADKTGKPTTKPKTPKRPPATAAPTWEELGKPQGPPPVGQPIGYEGGTYELLPGEPRRYRIINAAGIDISDQALTTPGRHQTAEDARIALRLDAFDREHAAANTKAGPAKTIAAVPVRWDLFKDDLSAGEDAIPAEHREDVRAALRDWKVWQSDREDKGTHGAEPMVNAVLRDSSPRSERSDRDIAALDTALDASRTTRASTVYRGFTDGTYMLPADWQTRDLTGVTWHEPTFPATSADRDLAETYVGSGENRGFLARIKLPKGSRAVAVTSTDPASLDDEKEIILPRGMTFRVVKDHGKQGELGLRLLDVAVDHDPRFKRPTAT